MKKKKRKGNPNAMRHLAMASSSQTVIDGLRWCSVSPPFWTRRIGLPILASKSSQTSMSTKMIDSDGLDTKVSLRFYLPFLQKEKKNKQDLEMKAIFRNKKNMAFEITS